MKKILFYGGFILLLALLICSGCNQRPKVKENKQASPKVLTGTVEAEVFDAVKLKDQIVEIIKTAPKTGELADFLNKIGVSYLMEFTLLPDEVEKYITVFDQSLAAGIYKFDLYYAKAYNRQDVVLQLVDVEEKLIAKIGLQGDIASMKKYNERIKQNKENSDSLNVIISALMNELAQSYSTGEHSGVYALSYISSNIEGLFILTQTALMAKDNTPLLELIGQQKERVISNYKLLEIMSADPGVAPIFEKMKPIMDLFSASGQFTAKQLAEVAPLISQLRNGIVK